MTTVRRIKRDKKYKDTLTGVEARRWLPAAVKHLRTLAGKETTIADELSRQRFYEIKRLAEAHGVLVPNVGRFDKRENVYLRESLIRLAMWWYQNSGEAGYISKTITPILESTRLFAEAALKDFTLEE